MRLPSRRPARDKPAPDTPAPRHKGTPKCSPCTLLPDDSTAHSHPKVTARGHTCRPPAAAPACPQGQRGTRPAAGSSATPCARSASPGRPLVSSAGRQSALGPQRARGASRALLVLAWAFPESPHPLDISANQSAWRSARRRPPAVQSALQVQPLRQDSASESRTCLFLQRMLQAGLGREEGEENQRRGLDQPPNSGAVLAPSQPPADLTAVAASVHGL